LGGEGAERKKGGKEKLRRKGGKRERPTGSGGGEGSKERPPFYREGEEGILLSHPTIPSCAVGKKTPFLFGRKRKRGYYNPSVTHKNERRGKRDQKGKKRGKVCTPT